MSAPITHNSDSQVVKGLFAALRTALPTDARLELLHQCSDELKFIIAVQPRVSSFSHRRRHSLRHPALSMAAKRFYYRRRQRRLDGAGRDLSARTQGERAATDVLATFSQTGTDAFSDASQRQRQVMAANSGYPMDSNHRDEDGWGEFGMAFSSSIWFLRRVYQFSSALNEPAHPSSQRSRRSFMGQSADSTFSVLRNSTPYVGIFEQANSEMDYEDVMVSSMNDSMAGASVSSFGGKGRRRVRMSHAKADAEGSPSRPAANFRGQYAMFLEDTEDDELMRLQQHEDDRWEHLGYAYDQMLRAAHSTAKIAAHTLALDTVMNDIIRRYWDRITVSPAAKLAYETSLNATPDDAEPTAPPLKPAENLTPRGSSAAPSAVAEAGVASMSELSVADKSRELTAVLDATPGKTGKTKKSKRLSVSRGPEESEPSNKELAKQGASSKAPGEEGTTGGESAPPAIGAKKRRKSVAGSPNQGRTKPKGVSFAPDAKLTASDVKPATVPKPDRSALKEPNPPPKRKKRTAPKVPGTAAYMTALQYVYLNTRIAHILLPSKHELEVEMVEAVQEDLIMDAQYREDDSKQELFFGRAPRLVSTTGEVLPINPEEPLTYSGVAPRRPRRRPDSGVSGVPMPDDSKSVGPMSMVAMTGTADENAVTIWNSNRLPSLTFSQFWNSMLELADNWTHGAGNPVESAIFLLELYVDAFGHDWSSEDEALMNALLGNLQSREASGEGESTDVGETEEALVSFDELLQQLDEWSSSDDLNIPSKDWHRRATEEGGRRLSGEDGSSYGSYSNGGSSDDDSNLRRGRWKYSKMIDRNGRMRVVRRKLLHVMSRKKRELLGLDTLEELEDDLQGDVEGSDDSDVSMYVLEEILNSKGKVIRRRVLHLHDRRDDGESTEGGDGGSHKRRGRKRGLYDRRSDERRTGDDGEHETSDDEFMYYDYEVDDIDGGDRTVTYRKRMLFDQPPRKTRRLERHRRKDDYLDHVDDQLSDLDSWSSYSAGDPNERASTVPSEGFSAGRSQRFHPLGSFMRRRRRVRRYGKRREMRRYGRDPAYYYDRAEGAEDEADDSLHNSRHQDSVNFSDFSYSTHEDLEVIPDDASDISVPSDHPEKDLTDLSPEQLAELLSKKAWLQAKLGAKGIHIPDATFDDPQEAVLLYQLLKMTERLAQKKVDQGGEEDDIGFAEFDAALMAKLFAKPQSYTLEELQKSELMKRLLEMADNEDIHKVLITENQRNGIFAALQGRPGERKLETTSMRLRREKLMQQAEMLQKALEKAEKQRNKLKKKEEAAERRRKREEAAAAAAAAKAGDTFGLTEVPTKTSARRELPPDEDEVSSSHDDRALMTAVGGPVGSRVPTADRNRARESFFTQQPYAQGDDLSFFMDNLTRAERREQARLFEEFEEFCAAEAAKGSRYRLKFTHYTPAQLEAFFQHLNLGPKQRALLTGRAPLAPPTSLMSGIFHQITGKLPDRQGVGFSFGMGGSGAGQSREIVDYVRNRIYQPVSVKLFTLTTQTSVEGALKESYDNYVGDRAYQQLLQGGGAPPQPPNNSFPHRGSRTGGSPKSQRFSVRSQSTRVVPSIQRKSSALQRDASRSLPLIAPHARNITAPKLSASALIGNEQGVPLPSLAASGKQASNQSFTPATGPATNGELGKVSLPEKGPLTVEASGPLSASMSADNASHGRLSEDVDALEESRGLGSEKGSNVTSI